METPMICKPRFPYLLWRSTKRGISSRHGPHQVAQKSSRTTFPRYCERASCSPVKLGNEKSGATGCSATAAQNAHAAVFGAALEDRVYPAVQATLGFLHRRRSVVADLYFGHSRTAL